MLQRRQFTRCMAVGAAACLSVTACERLASPGQFGEPARRSAAGAVTEAGPSSMAFDLEIVSSVGDSASRVPLQYHVERTREPGGGWTNEIHFLSGQRLLALAPHAQPLPIGVIIYANGDRALRLDNGEAAALSGIGDGMDALTHLPPAQRAFAAVNFERARVGASRVNMAWLDAEVMSSEERATALQATLRGKILTGRDAVGRSIYQRTVGDLMTTYTVDPVDGTIPAIAYTRGGKQVASMTHVLTTTDKGFSVRQSSIFRQEQTDGRPARTTAINIANVTINGERVP
jgi:hypothetical protein